MKLHEVLPHKQLDEKSLKHALAAGIVGTSLAMPGAVTDKQPPSHERPKEEVVATAKRTSDPFKPELNIPSPNLVQRTELAKSIAKKYRVDLDLVQQVVNLAYEYQDPEFPKAEDILAIIGVESSFNPESRSGLRKDPALGLMQVRPGIWNLNPKELESMESQIKYGTIILKRYYNKLGNAEDAIQAYNLGLTKFRRGGRNTRYVAKYQRELEHNVR